MSAPDLDRLVKLAVAGAPPLTVQQVSQLRKLLKPWDWAQPASDQSVREPLTSRRAA